MKLMASLVALLLCGSAFAQTLRIIVPFPPGGGADVLARLLAPKLAELRARQVVVENRPGASSQIGAEAVAQAPGDGQTLLLASTATLTEKNLARFAPVTLVFAQPYVLTVNASTRIDNVVALIAHARANPGTLTYGSSGVGAASQLSAELLKSMAGIDMLHVPYKGMGQAVTDLVAGQIDLVFAPSLAVMPHVRAGKLKALAITGARRSEFLPELPTVAESGLPGYESVGWYGLLAPAATPRAVLERLSAEVRRALADSDLRARMRGLGADVSVSSPDEFARYIRDDMAKRVRLMGAIEAE